MDNKYKKIYNKSKLDKVFDLIMKYVLKKYSQSSFLVCVC